MKILLGGIPLGCDNIGDEAIIAGVVKMLKESVPEVSLTVATADESTGGLLGVGTVPPYGFAGCGIEASPGLSEALMLTYGAARPAFPTILTSRSIFWRWPRGKGCGRTSGAWVWTTS